MNYRVFFFWTLGPFVLAVVWLISLSRLLDINAFLTGWFAGGISMAGLLLAAHRSRQPGAPTKPTGDAGFVMVPREPTDAMFDALSATGKMWRELNSREVYTAMISAAQSNTEEKT